MSRGQFVAVASSAAMSPTEKCTSVNILGRHLLSLGRRRNQFVTCLFIVMYRSSCFSFQSLLMAVPSVLLSSVLRRCWLGVRKSIWPLKKLSVDVLAWLSVWSEVQMICIWSSWCHCHPIISCFIKIWLTQVVLEKRLLNGCLSLMAVLKYLVPFSVLLPKLILHTVTDTTVTLLMEGG